MSVVYLDIETGGLEPGRPIIQLAAIAVGSELGCDWTEIEVFERKIAFDESKADPEALAINHHEPEVWRKEALPEARVVGEFAAMLNRYRSIELISKRTGNPYTVARVAGHNIGGFDLDRLSALFKKHGTFFAVDFRSALDTRHGAVWHFEQKPPAERPKDYTLVGLAKHLGIEVAGAHDALVDVRLSIAIAQRLLTAHGAAA